MRSKKDIWSLALLESLREAPLLAGDLPEAPSLDRSCLGEPEGIPILNFEQKLGHLYEDSLRALLDQSPAHPLLASGLQLGDAGGRTLGELDFLLAEPDGRRGIHLELAVKFYLGHFDSTAWQYPGPDPRDCWQRKLDRLRDHQLRLTLDPRIYPPLLERFALETISVRQLIYGRLFYPIDASEGPLPDGMSPNGQRGRWVYRSEWDRFFGELQSVRMIPKPLWPVEMNPAIFETLESVACDTALQEAAARCVLVTTSPESEPTFVVPDAWPTLDD